ncbi:MAG: flagellin, partial [Colwellia sp.]
MPQIINTNIASLTAQRNLNKSQSANQQALERLSSGLRINSAKDDAAGLAISTRFTSQIRGLNVAIRNAGDGISLAQTAEGALGTMNDNLQRIRELSVQSANATNSDVDREALQAEVDQLIAEVTRTADETDFNGRKLLDGSFQATFQIGANAGQSIDISIAQLTADKLGAGIESGISALGTDSALANGDLVINGTGINASSATDDTSSTNGADRSAISKAAAINEFSDTTGVVADVNVNTAAGTAQTAAVTNGSITLNNVRIDITTGGVDATADRASVLQAINAVSDQTGITAVDTGDVATGINLVADDGRNIDIQYNKFDSAGDTYASAVTAAATGLAEGGSSTAGAVARAAVISGVGTIGNIALTSLQGSFNIAIDGEEAVTVTLSGTAGATQEDVITNIQDAIDSALSAANLDVGVTLSVSSNGTISLTSNSTGPNSSLVLDTVVAGAAANSFAINSLLGLGSTGTTNTIISTSDADAIYFSATGSNGVENEKANLAGGVGLLENDGTTRSIAVTTITSADVNFAIEVDGGVAVNVTIAALGVGAAFTTSTQTDTYAASLETEINAQLLAAGQTGTVSVSIDEGFRLNITSNQEGTESSLRVSATNAGAIFVGIENSSNGVSATDPVALGSDGINNASQTYEGSITLRSINGDDIVINSGSGSLASSGLESGSFQAGQAYASSQSRNVAGAVATQGQVVGQRVSTGGLDDALVAAFDAAGGTQFTTQSFSIEVDGGDVVSVSLSVTNTTGDLDSLADYLTSLEAEINSSLVADGQTGTVSVSTNSDSQLVITSNSFGADSSIEISAVVTTTGGNAAIAVGLFTNLNGFGADGETAVSGTITGVGTTYTAAGGGTDLGQNFSTALATTNPGRIITETMRISVDGGETIDVLIAGATVSDAASALTYVETAINEALTAAGQTASIDLALNSEGYVTLSSNSTGSGSSVEVLASSTTDETFSGMAGLTAYHKSDAAVDGPATPDGLDSGDVLINGVSIEAASASDDTASSTAALSSSKQASGIAMAAAINKATDTTGVTATVNATVLNGGSQTATATTDTPQQGTLIVNGVETATLTTNGQNGGADDRTNTIDAINAITGQTGVTAIDNGEGITLEAADGRNISVVLNTRAKAATDSAGSIAALQGASIGLNVAEADITGGATYAATAQTAYSSVTLSAAGEINIEAGQNGATALENLGLRVGSYGASEAGVFIADIDITTVAGAEAALKAVDNAIGAVASQRATLGAIQNRMDSTVSNLSITSNNLSAANSRIQDA